MKKEMILISVLLGFSLLSGAQDKKYRHNILSNAEKKMGWKLLFDGHSMEKWRGFTMDSWPSNWHIENETITMSELHSKKAEDLISKEVFENFELSLEWKISEGGNSGIHFHVSIDPMYKSSAETGPEMQVLDNEGHPDGKGGGGTHRAGALYDLYPASSEVVRPVGQFNHVRLLVNNGHVEHWLNGVKIVEYELLGHEWKNKVTQSKFAGIPQFGRLGKGHIALQDHGNKVWYRNLKIRPLPSRGAAQKKVFAHYMIAHPPEASNTTIDDFKMEIRYAQEHGIDGFALNCGAWLGKEPHYRKRTVEMYEAARELNSGFLLFISADFCCSVTDTNFIDMVTAFRHHPNQYRIGKKPFISTFSGGKKNITAFVEKTFHGDSAIYFVPFYYPDSATELPTQEEIQQTLSTHSSIDGFFYFGAAGVPDAIADASKRIGRAWHTAGKTYMAPVTPFYQGLQQAPQYRLFESRGFEGMAKQWEAAIDAQADWVEIVTWNDYMENSYLSPIKTVKQSYLFYQDRYKWILSHDAFLKASRYYINWFKNGQPPAIKADELYYFYRIHPKNVVSALGEFKGREVVVDSIFTTVYAKAPAVLTVKVGVQTVSISLKKGINHIATALETGQPQFLLTRNGKTLINKIGEYTVSENNAWAEFNYYSGSASN